MRDGYFFALKSRKHLVKLTNLLALEGSLFLDCVLGAQDQGCWSTQAKESDGLGQRAITHLNDL